MKLFRWSAEKSLVLESDRAITVERMVIAIRDGGVLGVYEHPHRKRCPHQRILVVRCDDYAFLVPCVEAEDHLFQTTIVPSRKATRDYLRARDETEGELP